MEARARRHDKPCINGAKAPVQDADENLQRCGAYREYVQGTELFAERNVCKELQVPDRGVHKAAAPTVPKEGELAADFPNLGVPSRTPCFPLANF